MDATNTISTEQLLKLNNTLRTHGISLSTLIFVSCVEDEESSLKDICDKLGISSAGMTTIRDSASDKHFVKEVDCHDRRKRVYTITNLGIELLASLRQ